MSRNINIIRSPPQQSTVTGSGSTRILPIAVGELGNLSPAEARLEPPSPGGQSTSSEDRLSASGRSTGSNAASQNVAKGQHFHWNPYTNSAVIVSPTNALSPNTPPSASPQRPALKQPAPPPTSISYGESSAITPEATTPTAEERGHSQQRLHRTQRRQSQAILGEAEDTTTATTPKRLSDTAFEVFRQLQSETVDRKVASLVSNQAKPLLAEIMQYLGTRDTIVLRLCEEERGKIVTQCMEYLQGEDCESVVEILARNVRRLGTHRVGCVALTRSYEVLSPQQRRPLRTSILSEFSLLAVHSYGNFVASCILAHPSAKGHPGSKDSPVDDDTFSFVQRVLAEPNTLLNCCTSKSGSHVVETFLRNSPDGAFLAFVDACINDPETLQCMSESNIGNYPLQSMLRRLNRLVPSDHPTMAWCLLNIPELARSSPHLPNITLALTTHEDHRSRRTSDRPSTGQAYHSSRKPTGRVSHNSRGGARYR